MKRLFLTLLALAPAPAFATGAVQYPPGSSPQAIAVNEMVRAEIAGKPGPEFCLQIDTQDPHGRCLLKINLNAGGPGSGNGGGGGGSGGNGGTGGAAGY